jgi:hypothetical protein
MHFVHIKCVNSCPQTAEQTNANITPKFLLEELYQLSNDHQNEEAQVSEKY